MQKLLNDVRPIKAPEQDGTRAKTRKSLWLTSSRWMDVFWNNFTRMFLGWLSTKIKCFPSAILLLSTNNHCFFTCLFNNKPPCDHAAVKHLSCPLPLPLHSSRPTILYKPTSHWLCPKARTTKFLNRQPLIRNHSFLTNFKHKQSYEEKMIVF